MLVHPRLRPDFDVRPDGLLRYSGIYPAIADIGCYPGDRAEAMGKLAGSRGDTTAPVVDIAGRGRMRGLDRAFDILDVLRERRQPMRPYEIATQIGAPKSTTYELVNLLVAAGVLEHADREGRVFLGRRLYFLGLAYQQRFDVTRECRTYLDHLAEVTRETSQLCMLDGDKYTVAMMHEGRRPFRISSDVGEPVPIPWTASGRLLVSHLSDADILALVPAEDFILPGGERLPTATFLGEVHAAREAGFFSFDSLADNFTHCFAAPVHQDDGTCVATLCLIAPREDAARNYDRYRDALETSAAELSEKLELLARWPRKSRHGSLGRRRLRQKDRDRQGREQLGGRDAGVPGRSGGPRGRRAMLPSRPVPAPPPSCRRRGPPPREEPAGDHQGDVVPDAGEGADPLGVGSRRCHRQVRPFREKRGVGPAEPEQGGDDVELDAAVVPLAQHLCHLLRSDPIAEAGQHARARLEIHRAAIVRVDEAEIP